MYSCAVELPSSTFAFFIESPLDVSLDVPILACRLPDGEKPFSGAAGNDSVILLISPSLFLAPSGSISALFPIFLYWFSNPCSFSLSVLRRDNKFSTPSSFLEPDGNSSVFRLFEFEIASSVLDTTGSKKEEGVEN